MLVGDLVASTESPTTTSFSASTSTVAGTSFTFGARLAAVFAETCFLVAFFADAVDALATDVVAGRGVGVF